MTDSYDSTQTTAHHPRGACIKIRDWCFCETPGDEPSRGRRLQLMPSAPNDREIAKPAAEARVSEKLHRLGLRYELAAPPAQAPEETHGVVVLDDYRSGHADRTRRLAASDACPPATHGIVVSLLP